jgi:hypothetical protein
LLRFKSWVLTLKPVGPTLWSSFSLPLKFMWFTVKVIYVYNCLCNQWDARRFDYACQLTAQQRHRNVTSNIFSGSSLKQNMISGFHH